MAAIIDGKRISAEIKDEVKRAAEQLSARGRTVTLAVVQVGNDPASSVYVGNKKKACEYVGFRSLSYELPEETSEEELLRLIGELNGRKDVNGILVQLPLREQISEVKVSQGISRDMDVEGFVVKNVGRLRV
ncbi:MAG: bifunctional methylenetetrahydrofolate dehydrogenase/methenyltetrahydrofolate cyclohydrolase, partial [Lachnospiraceae bacterium]|nr:bifunctional methylenetetrahydrofolate dehydrogenase/methenyltetrahydrofolate cyclohydrolase [Lachnospiraceae bacterium]